MNEESSANNKAELQPYLSPIAVWSLSIGSAIGWGSLVVTSNSYLSQAGPAEEFDRFLIERAEAKAEVPSMAKKTCMSISKALTSDFESIYYVDVTTDFYLEFFMEKGGKLEIRPGGVDFFGEAREKILEDVCESDAEKLREATGKENLLQWIGQEEPVTLSYCKRINGVSTPYTLQTIKTRESDKQHIVIGVRQEK